MSTHKDNSDSKDSVQVELPIEEKIKYQDKDRVLKDVEKVQKEILWGVYQEYKNQARHTETIRANVANYMLVIASALITIITFDKKLDRSDILPSFLVCLIGIASGLFSVLYLNRYFKNSTRAYKILEELDYLFFENQARNTLASLKKSASDYRRNKFNGNHFSSIFSLSRKTVRTTHLFWLSLPLAVFVIGLLLTVLSIIGVNASST